MDLFSKIKQLNLDAADYVVVGGGVLVALGLVQQYDDIDIAVSPHLYAKLKANGWPEYVVGDKSLLRKDVFDVGISFGAWTIVDLQQDALVIRGVPFINPSKLLAWKRAAARPKDLPHIRLLKRFISEE